VKMKLLIKRKRMNLVFIFELNEMEKKPVQKEPVF
jgi:hypothetical protein